MPLAGRVAKKHGLLAAEEPLIVMRVDSVAQAVTNQHWTLLRAARFPLIGWTILIGLAAAMLWWRERPARRFGWSPAFAHVLFGKTVPAFPGHALAIKRS